MFGYVTVNRPEMKVKELERYRSYYCGLCHSLHERFGRRGQLFLSYDGVFLTILLTGLYEPEEAGRVTRCIVHPMIRHRERSNCYTAYAADMSILLAYRKALDDWRDEKKQSARVCALWLHGDYCRIRADYPRQERALAKNISALRRMERMGSGPDAVPSGGVREADRLPAVLARIDQVAGYTGRFFGEMCVVHRDHWARDLRRTGFYLGKFIYLMDAYDDLEEDEKRGSFNVLSELRSLEGERFEEILKEILMDTAACCCRSFERLPIINNVELLRNILYSGIWVRFHQIRSGEKTDRKRPGRQYGFL